MSSSRIGCTACLYAAKLSMFRERIVYRPIVCRPRASAYDLECQGSPWCLIGRAAVFGGFNFGLIHWNCSFLPPPVSNPWIVPVRLKDSQTNVKE